MEQQFCLLVAQTKANESRAKQTEWKLRKKPKKENSFGLALPLKETNSRQFVYLLFLVVSASVLAMMKRESLFCLSKKTRTHQVKMPEFCVAFGVESRCCCCCCCC